MIVKNNRDQEVILSVCTVKEKIYISPGMIRVIFRSDAIEDYAEVVPGATIKIFFPHPETGDIIYPSWLPVKEVDPDLAALYRTFTLRHLDLRRNELWIDFVYHGEEGYASWWASTAEPGDKLAVAAKKRKSRLVTDRMNYLMAVDHTGLPFVAAVLERLPENAGGEVVLEVSSEADILPLKKPAGIRLHWLINPLPGEGSRLSVKVRALDYHPTENRYAYVAAEFHTVKDLRHYLRRESRWGIDELNALSYWKQGKSETESVYERLSERNE